jgi:hypothetical protein
MNGRTSSVDTSAFVKLLVVEPESVALGMRLRRWPDRASLAAALSIGPELGVFVTYDGRLREAALSQGFDVESPS